jgi:hypothetical protein
VAGWPNRRGAGACASQEVVWQAASPRCLSSAIVGGHAQYIEVMRGFLRSCTMPRVHLVEPDADQRMRRPSQELKWAHRGWRRFLDEPARRAAPLVALPGLRLHFMACPSVRFRTFPLKHVHCGNAVTIDGPLARLCGPPVRSWCTTRSLNLFGPVDGVRTSVLPARGLL